MGQRVEKYFWNEKEKLLEIEKRALKNNSRLYLYHQILTSTPKFFNISQKDNFKQENRKLFKKIQKYCFRRTIDNDIGYFYDLNLKEIF